MERLHALRVRIVGHHDSRHLDEPRRLDVGIGVPNALLILCGSKDEPDIRKVRALLDGGADVRARGPGGMPALMWALFRGHTDAAKAILEADPSIEHVRMTNNNGVTVLMCASELGNNPGKVWSLGLYMS